MLCLLAALGVAPLLQIAAMDLRRSERELSNEVRQVVWYVDFASKSIKMVKKSPGAAPRTPRCCTHLWTSTPVGLEPPPRPRVAHTA